MKVVRTVRAWPILVLSASTLVFGCADPAAPRADGAAQTTAAPTPDSSRAGASASESAVTVADLFPAGAGREAVLNNCGSCHNLACSTIGQRTASRWDALRESHKERVSDADMAAAFAYLKAHFDDSKPEPQVPPKFLEGGCTPF